MTRRSRQVSGRTFVRSAAVLVPVTALVVLTGCGSNDDEPSSSGEVTYQTVPVIPPEDGITVGSEDQEIGEIPEKVYTNEIDPIGPNELLAVAGGFGKLELGVNVIDPVTGVAGSRIVVGPGIWDPVIHGFVGEQSSDPAVLAAEVWRPRGSRGAADFTVTTYSGNLIEPDEVLLPDYARVHSRPGSNAVTSDGRYFVTWDDGLYGIRVVDLEVKEESGSLQVIGCGPFTWMVGHELYSVCEDAGELLHVGIDDSGVPSETARSAVLPDDFVSNRKAAWAADADSALLVGANGDVYVFDFSDGLPESEVAPIGNAGRDGGRFAENTISADGTRIAIEYTDSVVHPHSARAGDVVRIELFDAEGLATVASLDLEALGLTSIDSTTFSVDGKTLYVLGSGPEQDGESGQKIVGIAAEDGAQVSSADVSGNVDDLGTLLTPQVIE